MIWDHDHKIIKITIGDVSKFYLHGKYYVIHKLTKKRKNSRNDMNTRCLLTCATEPAFPDKNSSIRYTLLSTFGAECRF